MVREQGRLTDTLTSTPRGVHCGADPSIIGKAYVAFAVNATMRGGFIQTRPGIKQLQIDYNGNEALQDGLFQDAGYFQPRDGNGCLMALISGHLSRYQIGLTNKVYDRSIPGDLNSAIQPQAWHLDAEDWYIVQNGLQRPLFFDGSTTRRAAIGEMRPGCMMEYSQGRIGYIRPDRISIRFGDIVYGPSGTAGYGFRDAILKDTENDFLNEGGEFAVPGGFGKINAIKNIAVLDHSMGQGPVQVYCERAVFSMNLPTDRTTWKNLTFPAETATLIAPGAQAQDSTINVNGDVWYRAKDGIRTLVQGIREFTAPGNTPQSQEMNLVLQADDERLLNSSSSILFNNRLIHTCSPGTNGLHGVWHRGLCVLDFDISGAMSNKLPPAYDGLWTGIRVLKLITGDFAGIDRAFAFILNLEDKIELWEITKADIADNRDHRIEWYYETPSMFDGSDYLKLTGGRLSVDEMSGSVDFNVRFKPDDYAHWFSTCTPWSECAVFETCSLSNCEPPGNFSPQYRSRMGFNLLGNDDCVTEDKRPSRSGSRFQFRVEITGKVRVKKLLVHGLAQEEPTAEMSRGEGACIASNICPLPVFSYSAEERIVTPA